MNSIRQADGFPLLDRLDALASTPAQTARAVGQRAWYCSQLARDADAVRFGEQALALAEPLGERVLTGQIRQRLATTLAMLGRFDAALAHLQAVEAWADDQLAPDDLAEFHGNFAVVLDNLGRPEPARLHHRRAIEGSRSVGDRSQLATHIANHTVSRINAGDVRGARGLVEQAQQLVAAYGLDGSSAGFVAVLQMQCARAEGRYTEALACAEHAEAILQASNPARVPVVRLHRGHCWLDLGQFARARQELQSAGDGERLPPHFEARRLLLLARVQRALGQETETLLLQARRAAPPNGWPEVRMMIDIEVALDEPAPQALALLAVVRERAEALGLRGSVLAALVRGAGIAAGLDGPRAAAMAQAARALAEEVEATLMTPAELWLNVARGLRAGAEDASAALAAGRLWLRTTHAENVPEPFRASFLERNPTNRALLAA